MVDLKIATLDGKDTMLSESVIADFKKSLRGN